jgi:hypothetical protein
MSSAYPTKHNIGALPKFRSPDPGLERALNLLADAISNIKTRTLTMPGDKGTAQWSDSAVTLRPTVKRPRSLATPPWTPIYRYNSAGLLEVGFTFGVINNVAPANIRDYSQIGEEELAFVVAKLSFSNGRLTPYMLSLVGEQPTDDPVTQNSPPASVDVLMGMLYGTQYSMLYDTNLMTSVEQVFVTSKSGTLGFGEDPYNRWYRLIVTPI